MILAVLLVAATVSQHRIELLRLEKVWNDAHLHADAAALDALWADDLVIAAPHMVLNKQQAMDVWRTHPPKFTRYETSDLTIHIFRDSAVVTGRLQREGNFNGKPRVDDWRFTKVYERKAGKWRVIAFHASEAPQ